MGWSAPWYSSFGSDFNYDFHTTKGETAGLSVFLHEDGAVYHTYSSYDGEDLLYGTYNYLDLTPLGRQEEDQPGRPWLRHHDKYGV